MFLLISLLKRLFILIKKICSYVDQEQKVALNKRLFLFPVVKIYPVIKMEQECGLDINSILTSASTKYYVYILIPILGRISPSIHESSKIFEACIYSNWFSHNKKKKKKILMGEESLRRAAKLFLPVYLQFSSEFFGVREQQQRKILSRPCCTREKDI